MVGVPVTWYGNWASVGGKERTRPRGFVEDRKSGGRRGEDKQLSTGSLPVSVVSVFSLVFSSPPIVLLFPPSGVSSRFSPTAPYTPARLEKVTLFGTRGHGGEGCRPRARVQCGVYVASDNEY